jgi:hypothetical protein
LCGRFTYRKSSLSASKEENEIRVPKVLNFIKKAAVANTATDLVMLDLEDQIPMPLFGWNPEPARLI